MGGSVLTAITTFNGATGSTTRCKQLYPGGGHDPLGKMLLGEVIFGGRGSVW